MWSDHKVLTKVQETSLKMVTSEISLVLGGFFASLRIRDGSGMFANIYLSYVSSALAVQCQEVIIMALTYTCGVYHCCVPGEIL